MTTTLREAAQALAHAVKRYDRDGGTQPFRELVEDADAILALPPSPDRWTEGAEAMREVADEAVEVAYDLVTRDPTATPARLAVEIHRALAALPVPAATTGEAKIAESAIGWVVRHAVFPDPLIDAALQTLYATPAAAEAERAGYDSAEEFEVIRVRITPEPAPVEPEETQR